MAGDVTYTCNPPKPSTILQLAENTYQRARETMPPEIVVTVVRVVEVVVDCLVTPDNRASATLLLTPVLVLGHPSKTVYIFAVG